MVTANNIVTTCAVTLYISLLQMLNMSVQRLEYEFLVFYFLSL